MSGTEGGMSAPGRGTPNTPHRRQMYHCRHQRDAPSHRRTLDLTNIEASLTVSVAVHGTWNNLGGWLGRSVRRLYRQATGPGVAYGVNLARQPLVVGPGAYAWLHIAVKPAATRR